MERAFDEVAAARCAAGELVGIFPEGRSPIPARCSPFRPGIKHIVEPTPVPVVPMALRGLWGSFFSRSTRARRCGGGAAFSRASFVARRPVAPATRRPRALHPSVLALRGDPALVTTGRLQRTGSTHG